MTLEECTKLNLGNIVKIKTASTIIKRGRIKFIRYYMSNRCREADIIIEDLDTGENIIVDYRHAVLLNTLYVVLSEDDCYCSIVELYEKVAKDILKKSIDSGLFDCKKICVTPGIIDMLYKFYENEKGLTRSEITSVLLIYGPKGNLDISDSGPYVAKLEDGFYIE